MLQPGDTFGEYEVVALLGSGGQGDVFRVHDRLGLEWALKVSHEFTFDSPGAEARFHQEAQWVSKALRGLPRDCGVFVGEHYGIEARRFYAKMRLLTGESLAARLRRVGRFSLREALTFGEHVARAVAAAHRAGALHRDLKPENVFIEGDGKVQVLDWGCLQVIEAGRAGTTGSGPICTPGYAGLEQYQGERAQLTASTDVYSLGVMLYEAIAGCHPFLGWARGPRPSVDDDGSPPSVEAVLTHFPAVPAGVSVAASPLVARSGAVEPAFSNLPVNQRRWGVGDECVTMPADFGRRAGHFDQAGILNLLKQDHTLVPPQAAGEPSADAIPPASARPKGRVYPGGRILRAEELRQDVPDLRTQDWPSQAQSDIRHPTAAQLANQVVVPQRGEGGLPLQPSTKGRTQRMIVPGKPAPALVQTWVGAPSIEVTSFEVDASELARAELPAAVPSAEQPTASLSELQRAGREIPGGLRTQKPNTSDQARQLASLWNVPSTHTASRDPAAIDEALVDVGARGAEEGAAKPAPRPRKFSTSEVIRLQLRVRPRLIEGVPDGMWQLIERMLAKHPEKRPQTMAEVADALRVLLGQLEESGEVELNSVTVDQSQATWQHLQASLQRLDRDEASAQRRQKLGRAVMLVCGGAAAIGVLVLTQTHPNRSVASEPATQLVTPALTQAAVQPGPAVLAEAPKAPAQTPGPGVVDPPAQPAPRDLASERAAKSKRPLATSKTNNKSARKPTQTNDEAAPEPAASVAPRSALLIAPPVARPSQPPVAKAAGKGGAAWVPAGFSRLTPEQERAQVRYLSGSESAPATAQERGKP